MRVISGHLGWVRSVAVEPGNKWFATGAGDRVIKVISLSFLRKDSELIEFGVRLDLGFGFG